MKRRNIYLMLFGLLLVAITACTKESLQGPVGVKGPLGDPGPKGEQGETGEGISNVRKFSFTIEKGTAFSNNANPNNGPWWGRQRGLGNNGAECTIAPEQIGNLSLDDPNYLVLAYAKPEGHPYTQRKMLPFNYSIGTADFKIELIPSLEAIMVSKKVNGTSAIANPTFPEMPEKLHVDIYFIEIGNKTL